MRQVGGAIFLRHRPAPRTLLADMCIMLHVERRAQVAAILGTRATNTGQDFPGKTANRAEKDMIPCLSLPKELVN